MDSHVWRSDTVCFTLRKLNGEMKHLFIDSHVARTDRIYIQTY